MKWNQRAVHAQGPTVVAVGEAHDPIGEVVTNLEVATLLIISTHLVTKRLKSGPILEEISEGLKDQVRFHTTYENTNSIDCFLLDQPNLYLDSIQLMFF